VTIDSDLRRARRLVFAADEIAAKELLLSLGEHIEEFDRDDLLLEVYAQFGELYLVRTAYDGVEVCLQRMTDCLAIYQSIRAGSNPELAARVTMSDADVDMGPHPSGAIATGVDSVNWRAVPPGIFDAAERTVGWRIEAADGFAKAVVHVELSGQGLASGIEVRLRSGGIGGLGVLDADGVAAFPLVDGQQQPVTESAAWDHDWRSTAVTVGADVRESQQTRADPRLRAGAPAWPCG
jgi:hypothetical protein